MADLPREGHNGHHDVSTGAERIRSGFDRRKNWGQSIENIYQRLDHRLAELVRQGSEKKEQVEQQAEETVREHPALSLAACFATGILVGFLLTRGRD